jgi:N-acetylglutamate synthase-like GNAT family acetyltransferase
VWADHPAEVVTPEIVDRYLQHLGSTIPPSRLAAAAEAMAACGAHTPATAHAVLHSIAVPAHAQGAGAGSLLLRQLLHRSDERGVPVYLESSSARNLSFYTRHGFRAWEGCRFLAARTG